MNKAQLLVQIIQSLRDVQQSAAEAVRQAHDTATDDENVAENKYDTLGLEASYLAHGQAQRLAECEQDLAVYGKMVAVDFDASMPAAMGALVLAEDEQGDEFALFLGPAAGGLKLEFDGHNILVITPSSPLGSALVRHCVDDEIKVAVGGETKHYAIIEIH